MRQLEEVAHGRFAAPFAGMVGAGRVGFEHGEAREPSANPQHQVACDPLGGSERNNRIGIRILSERGDKGRLDPGAREINRDVERVADVAEPEPAVRLAGELDRTSPTTATRGFCSLMAAPSHGRSCEWKRPGGRPQVRPCRRPSFETLGAHPSRLAPKRARAPQDEVRAELLRMRPSRRAPASMRPQDDGPASSRHDRRMILQRVGQRPQQEQHDRQVHEQLQEGEADDVARAQARARRAAAASRTD